MSTFSATRLLIFFVFFCPFLASAQPNLLQSGPMLGYTDMFETALWVQTNAPATVKFVYWDSTAPQKKYSTNEVKTEKQKGFTAQLTADEVQPGNVYFYELYINNQLVPRPYPLRFQTLKLWSWRTDPPNFRFLTGSCIYINEAQYDRPGKPYGSDSNIVTAMFNKHADMMLWLGDNIYLREPDWNTWTGILHRYTHTRSLPELQPLLASTHHYAIWDDHDFGPNDSDRGFWNKEKTLEAFKLFWANLSYGINGKPGITSRAEWGDVEFFLLDNRYYRSPDNGKAQKRVMFDDEQIQWLMDNLITSKATFKIIAMGRQALNPVKVYENYSTYEEERTKLLDLIAKEKIKGVLFLSGDRHHTELTKMPREGTYPLYDFTISPFTAGTSAQAENEANPWRIPGTFVGGIHNFAAFDISGPRTDRTLKCTVFDKDGKELWHYTIQAKELQ